MGDVRASALRASAGPVRQEGGRAGHHLQSALHRPAQGDGATASEDPDDEENDDDDDGDDAKAEGTGPLQLGPKAPHHPQAVRATTSGLG